MAEGGPSPLPITQLMPHNPAWDHILEITSSLRAIPRKFFLQVPAYLYGSPHLGHPKNSHTGVCGGHGPF